MLYRHTIEEMARAAHANHAVAADDAEPEEVRTEEEVAEERGVDAATEAAIVELLQRLRTAGKTVFGGVAKLWDPDTDRLYDTDQRRSAIWKDITETTLLAATKRIKRLTGAIRAVADVPVTSKLGEVHLGRQRQLRRLLL